MVSNPIICITFGYTKTLKTTTMKTKSQLQEMGFVFTTTSGGAISVLLLDSNMSVLFSTKAKSISTVVKRCNAFLNK